MDSHLQDEMPIRLKFSGSGGQSLISSRSDPALGFAIYKLAAGSYYFFTAENWSRRWSSV
jgi:hypothetical protein